VLQGVPISDPVPDNSTSAYVNWRLVLGAIVIWSVVIAALAVLLPETEPKVSKGKRTKRMGRM
jgi:hypothetical protein